MKMTTFVLQSAHHPTDAEVEAVLDAMLAAAARQGFEPLRAQAIYESRATGRGMRRGDTRDHEEIKASRVVNDGVIQTRWERRPGERL